MVTIEHEEVNSNGIIKFERFEMQQQSPGGEQFNSMKTKVWSDTKFTAGNLAWVKSR